MFGISPIYPRPDKTYMRKDTYDVNDNNIVDSSESLSDGTKTVTASEARDHIDQQDIHNRLDDSIIDANTIWSSQKVQQQLNFKANRNHRHTGDQIDIDSNNFDSLLGSEDTEAQKAFQSLNDSVKYSRELKSFVITTKGDI